LHHAEEFISDVNDVRTNHKGTFFLRKKFLGQALMKETMVRNRRTRSDYLLYNEVKKIQTLGKMNIHMDEIRRLKGMDQGMQQYMVKNIHSLTGKRKNGPRLNIASIDDSDEGIKKKTKVVLTEDERALKSRTLYFAWYKAPGRFPIDAREGATWTRVNNKAYLIGGINKNMVDQL
jgi:hypothetical protein